MNDDQAILDVAIDEVHEVLEHGQTEQGAVWVDHVEVQVQAVLMARRSTSRR
jgi:hypothetical protein